MDSRIDAILDGADWKDLTPRLLGYAHNLICRALWRGQPVTVSARGLPCIDGLGADDIVQSAVGRFLDEIRVYNHEITLEMNLKGAIRSLISSWNKSVNRRPLSAMSPSEPGRAGVSPVENVPDDARLSDDELAEKEAISKQRALLASFEDSLKDDVELRKLASAYKQGVHKPREVESATGISAIRVYELTAYPNNPAAR